MSINNNNSQKEELVFLALSQALADQPQGVNWPVFNSEDWKRLGNAALAEGVAPLIYWTFKTTGWPESMPPGAQKIFSEAYYQAAAQNQVLYQEMAQILKAFAQAQVPAVVLKGAALAVSLYPDPSLRPMGDVDLLVSPKDLDRAAQIILSQGYRIEKYPEMAPGLNRVVGCHLVLRGVQQKDAVIELHWSLINWQRSQSLEWFWRHTETHTELHEETTALVLKPTAQLLYAAAHLQLHHHYQQRLLWYYDLNLLINRFKDRIDWDELLEKTREFRWNKELYQALSGVQARFGTPLPAGYLEALRNGNQGVASIHSERSSFSEKRMGKVWSALSSLDGWGRVRLVLRGLFPSATYITFTYVPKHAWLLPFYYLVHWGGILRDSLKVLGILILKRAYSIQRH